MGAVQISGTFKKDERPYNGLEQVSKDFAEDPLTEFYVIAKVECVGFNEDRDNDWIKVPRVRFTHIEVMQSDKEESAARKLFDQACKARLGELPKQTLFDDGKGSYPDDERDNG